MENVAYALDDNNEVILRRDGNRAKKRGRKPGHGQLSKPYFPDRVATIAKLYEEGKSFDEIAAAVGSTRGAVYYLYRRWVKNDPYDSVRGFTKA